MSIKLRNTDLAFAYRLILVREDVNSFIKKTFEKFDDQTATGK